MTRFARLLIPSLMLVGFVLVPIALIHPAQGQVGCNAASLSGPYGIIGSGTIFGSPSAFVGTFVFDGNGNEKNGSIALNLNGGIDHIKDITGAYKFDSDCDGTLTIHTVHNHPPVSHYHDMDLVVVDGGREAFFTVGSPKDSAASAPPPGEVLSGTLKRL
jgi:hypothetical protein